MYCTVSPCVFPAPRLDSCFVFFFLRTSGAACWEINFRKTTVARAKPRLVIKIVLPMLLLPIKIVLLLATPINALRIHPFAVPSCAPQSARAALVVMRWDPKKDPIEDPVPFEVRDGRVPEYKPPAPEYQRPEDGCEIVCYHPRRCLRFRCDRLAPLL